MTKSRPKWYIILFSLLTLSNLSGQRAIDSIMVHANSLPEGVEKAKQYLLIATAYLGYERDTAEHFFEKSWHLLQKFPDPDLIADAKTTAVQIFRQDWTLDTLKGLLEEAMKHFHEVNDREDILANLINLSTIYSNRSLYEESIPYSLQALDLAKDLKDTLQQGKIAFNLGIVYYNTSIFDEATSKFRESSSLFKSIDNESLAGMALSGLVNVFLNSDQNDSALFYAKELLILGDTLNYSRLQLNARSNLGAIYNNLGDHQQAVKYYSEAQAFAKRFGSKLSMINCWCALGKSFAYLNELDSSAHYFELAYALNDGANDPIMHQYCSKEFADVLYKRGQIAKSTNLLLEYVNYQDSVLAKENKEVIAGLEKKYQASRKDTEIAQQELTIERRTSQRNLYLLGLLFALGLMGFLVYRYQQNKRLQSEKIQNLEKYQRILAMDSVMQGQEEERKRIAQDLHDGLGTLLAAARMQMQSIQREVDKLGELKLVDKTEQLLDHACKEVRRISHDMMPSALVDLGLVAAIQDLVDEIRLQQELIFKLDLPDHSLNLDNSTSLHLYRIVQEILQNIIKHANANIVEISFSPSTNGFNLFIEDDGLGFDLAQSDPGIGLSSIRSRVAYLKGQLTLDTGPGKGCAYRIEIPQFDLAPPQ